MGQDFLSVTEIVGDEITREQLDRVYHRYYWAGGYCENKDVVEVACGSGAGLGYLSGMADSFVAGDYSVALLKIADEHYNGRIKLIQFDAQYLPFKDSSKDVIILFEAMYYLPDAKNFVNECKRVLRPSGYVLIATANKDLFDFNPSPLSYKYYGTCELKLLFQEYGFEITLNGVTPIEEVSWWQRILRPVKMLLTKANLLPKTMKGKKLLKKIVFGKLLELPSEINDHKLAAYMDPGVISASEPDRRHKVIYCAARLGKQIE